MPVHYLPNVTNRVIIHLKSAEYRLCHLLTSQCVTLEMIHARLVCGLAVRLSDIVKQRCVSKRLGSWYISYHFHRMPSNIVAVKWAILRCLHHSVELRKDHLRDAELVHIYKSLWVR